MTGVCKFSRPTGRSSIGAGCAVNLWIAPWRLADLFASPSRAQRRLLLGVLLATLALGVVGEVRGTFVSRRMGDLPLFLRAGWAVSAGEDLYTVTDHNGWHYHYPPFLAVLLVPLAQPPPGAGTPALPYPTAIAVWFAISALALALGVHALAGALEAGSTDRLGGDSLRGTQRWWSLRLAPILICLPAVGSSIVRGQVNLLVAAALCAMVAAALRDHRFRAGLWLALAVCLKVLPIVLVLYPLWRRDRRWLAGVGLGLTLGLAALPALYLGPRAGAALTLEWMGSVVSPIVGLGADRSRSDELLSMNNNDNQSFMAVVHSRRFAATPPAERPTEPDAVTRTIHWTAALLLVVSTLAAARADVGPLEEAALLGMFTVVMVLISPASHLHYLSFGIPLAMAVLALALERDAAAALRRVYTGIALLYPAAICLAQLPGLEPLRHGGLAASAMTALWSVGLFAVTAAGRRASARERERVIGMADRQPLSPVG